MTRKISWIFVITILFVCQGLALHAQPGGGGSPGGGGPPVPITGIEWVLGAGALIGARKMYNKHKRSSKDN